VLEGTLVLASPWNGRSPPRTTTRTPPACTTSGCGSGVASLDNDRYSLVRELTRRHTCQNLYTVLLGHTCATLAEAVHTAACLRDRVFLRFLRLRDTTRPRLSTAGRMYLDGLGHGIRGNAEWGQRVPRYVSRGADPGPANEAAITWAESPLDDSADPLPYPTVSWWWDRAL
jgi:hypothetical protein